MSIPTPRAQLSNPGCLTPTPTCVRAVHRETHDTVTLELDAPCGDFRFRPGQFNMLYAFGVGEAAISMSGDSSDPTRIFHTIRGVGPVTNALIAMTSGAAIGLRGPFGSNWPIQASRGRDLVIVTGGIGLAPLRPVVLDVLSRRSEYGKVTLLHGVRSQEEHLYAQELETWRRSNAIDVQLAATKAGPGWPWRAGVVTTLFEYLSIDPQRTLGFICGPDVMIHFALREFGKHGIADDRLFVSLERNMQCATGFCGHCQFGPSFVCMDGPVFRVDRIRSFLDVLEA